MGKIKVLLFIFIYATSSQATRVTNRAPAAMPNARDSCLELFSAFTPTEKKNINLPITIKDNEKFINLVRSKKYSKNEIFWHLDNTVLKALNDNVYKDKEITHGITIFFQQRMMKYILENKLLQTKMNEKYFDYKTLRLSFKDLEQKDLADEMLKIFIKANDDLEVYLKEKKLNEKLSAAPFLTRNFKNWFAQGIAAVPDQAALVARLARNQSQQNLLMTHTFDEAKEVLLKQFDNTKKINIEVTHLLNYDPKGFIWSDMKIEGNQKRVLSRDFLDLLRKSDFYTPAGRSECIRKINLFAGTSLGEKNLDVISQYYNNLNYFSSSVLQKETTMIDWSMAKNGFVSFDFIKKGAEGLQHVAAHIEETRSIEELINSSRKGFWQVDNSIKENVEMVKKVVGKKNYQSGDDLIIFNDTAYRGDEIIEKIHELIVTPKVEDLRVVFYRGEKAEVLGDRARDIGESFLKKYRISLDELFKRSTQDEVLTFVEVFFGEEGAVVRVFYRVKDYKMEKKIQEWNKKYDSDIVFLKI